MVGERGEGDEQHISAGRRSPPRAHPGVARTPRRDTETTEDAQEEADPAADRERERREVP
jgi:hypothetical protein